MRKLNINENKRKADMNDPSKWVPLSRQLAEQVRQVRRDMDLKPDKLVRHIPEYKLPPKPERKPRIVAPNWLTIAERKIWTQLRKTKWYVPYKLR